MKTVWKKMEKWLSNHNPDAHTSLAPPAEEPELKSLQNIIGLELPSDYVDSLRVHNGMRSFALYDEWRLLSTSEVIDQWKLLGHIQENDVLRTVPVNSHKKIQKVWWQNAWIPVAGDDCGNFLCLDMAPSDKGDVGQVICFLHDDPMTDYIAKSFRGFLQLALRELKKQESNPPSLRPFIGYRNEQKIICRTVNDALKLVWQGNLVDGEKALVFFSENGSVAAATARSQIAAFQGDWQSAMSLLLPLFRTPDAYGAINPIQQAISLLITATQESEDWEAGSSVFAQLHQAYKQKPGLARLITLTNEIFDKKSTKEPVLISDDDNRSRDERVSAYEKYLMALPTYRHLKSDADRARNKLSNLIENFQLWEEALKIMQLSPDVVRMADVVSLAPHLIETNQNDLLLELIEKHLPGWHPEWEFDVAPVSLLLHSPLRAVLSQSLRNRILETPRAKQHWDFPKAG